MKSFAGNGMWLLWGGLSLFGLGCYGNQGPAPGWESGNKLHVTTPASGANAQGAQKRAPSNSGITAFNTDRCYYPDVSATDRRGKLAPCVNTFEVGGGEEHGAGKAPEGTGGH